MRKKLKYDENKVVLLGCIILERIMRRVFPWSMNMEHIVKFYFKIGFINTEIPNFLAHHNHIISSIGALLAAGCLESAQRPCPRGNTKKQKYSVSVGLYP